MIFKKYTLFVFLLWSTFALSQNTFINEVDYLQPDLCVEIAAAPGTDLTDWFVTTYDETGTADDTISLTGVPPTSTTSSGFNIIEVDIVMLSPTNGGMVLVDNNNMVVQFLSYSGALTANDGPAGGQTAEDIGTQTASGNSLQLEGVGAQYEDFNWSIPGAATCGFENDNQELLAPDNPLPIGLLYFDAVDRGGQVALSWATAFEKNNKYFAVERSTNGKDFEAFYRQAGGADTDSRQDYSIVDNRPFQGTVYYRLRQVDLNERVFFSPLKALHRDAVNTILVYPNPVQGELYILLPASKIAYSIEIYNSQGALVHTEQTNPLAGDSRRLDWQDMPAGVYYLLFKNGAQQQRFKIVKL